MQKYIIVIILANIQSKNIRNLYIFYNPGQVKQ